MLIPADVIYEKLEAVYNFSAFRNGEEKMVRGVCFYTQKGEDENSIFSIFRDSLIWEEQLQSCENSFTGIKGMMRISYYFSNADFVLTDSNLRYLYYTKSFLDYHFMENKLSAVPTQDIVRILLNDPDFHRRQSTWD